MRRWGSWIAVAILCTAGCAEGGGAIDGGGGGGGEGGTRDGGRDGGGGVGEGGVCTDDSHPSTCDMAMELGMLEAGATPITISGYVPTRADEDWFHVSFPAMPPPADPDAGTASPSMEGGGEPRVQLTPPMGEMRFEVRGSCSMTLSCGDEMTGARDIIDWSFTDDASDPGAGAFSSRNVPWPSEIWIRVYRVLGAGDCTQYELSISR